MQKYYKKLSFLLKAFGAIIVGTFIGVLIIIFFQGLSHFPVLNPKGLISSKERSLMIMAISLLLFVAIPVVLSMFFIIFKYRSKNEKSPADGKVHPLFMLLWWIIPGIVIAILSVVTWVSTHELDPRKPLSSSVKPMTIQVVALQWKWLFIYPEQNIATVNFVEFPEKTPITFELTAQAPMNSFWIPQLGGQMYAMEGMVNKLHLIANEAGTYKGSDAEISGAGFASMRFNAKAVAPNDFDNWVEMVKLSRDYLGMDAYQELAKPSEKFSLTHYYPVQKDLYNAIIMKYMPPTSHDMEMH
jgi:cytochrome o ubiquinol oxidase subunit 2